MLFRSFGFRELGVFGRCDTTGAGRPDPTSPLRPPKDPIGVAPDKPGAAPERWEPREVMFLTAADLRAADTPRAHGGAQIPTPPPTRPPVPTPGTVAVDYLAPPGTEAEFPVGRSGGAEGVRHNAPAPQSTPRFSALAATGDTGTDLVFAAPELSAEDARRLEREARRLLGERGQSLGAITLNGTPVGPDQTQGEGHIHGTRRR